MRRKILTLNMLLVTMLVTIHVSKAQKETFGGHYFELSGITLEGHWYEDSQRVYTNFATSAPEYSGHENVHGSGDKFFFVAGQSVEGLPHINVSATIEKENIDDWMRVTFIPVNWETNPYRFKAEGLLTKEGFLVDPRTNQRLHLGMEQNDYYLLLSHSRYVDIMHNEVVHITNDGSLIKRSFDHPSYIYGKKPLKYVQGRWSMYAGDNNGDNFSGLLDYLLSLNSQNDTGYVKGDINASSMVDVTDLNIIWDNFYRMAQTPWIKPRKESEITFRGINAPSYVLKAENFRYEITPLEITELVFDLNLKAVEGQFLFGAAELVIQFDSTYLNGGAGSISFDEPISNIHRFSFGANEVRILLLSLPDEEDTISEENRTIATIRLKTSSINFGSGGMTGWINPRCILAQRVGSEYQPITDSTNHIFSNGLLTSIHNQVSLGPKDFVLSQNYPNPFNPVTTINFTIPNQGLVSLKVYDVLGQEVMTVLNEVLSSGSYSYEIKFNEKNLSSGSYYYRLEAGEFMETKKMILMK